MRRILACLGLVAVLTAAKPAAPPNLVALRDPRVVGHTGVACAPGTCLVTAATAKGGAVLTVSTDATRTTAPVLVAGSDTLLPGVACPAPSRCVVVGSVGGGGNRAALVSTFRGALSAPRLVPATGVVAGPGELLHVTFDGVACRSAVACTALGWRKERFNSFQVRTVPVIAELTDGVPGPPVSVAGFAPEPAAIACPSGTRCLLVGRGNASAGAVVIVDKGVAGVGKVVPDGTTLSSIACATPTRCWAVGYTGARPGTRGMLVPVVDGIPGRPVFVLDGHLDRIACASATTCVAVGFSAAVGRLVVVPVVDGKPQSARKVDGLGAVAGVSCAGPTACLAVGTVARGNTTEGAVLAFSIDAVRAGR